MALGPSKKAAAKAGATLPAVVPADCPNSSKSPKSIVITSYGGLLVN